MPSAVRAVLDTNVAVSALLFGGVPSQLLELGRTGGLALYTSEGLLDELADVLNRSKFARRFDKNRPVTPAFLLRRYTVLAASVALGPIERTVPTDPDDDVVIATAVAAGAKLIVSGDSDLLVLHPFRGISVLAPTEAIRLVTGNASS